MSEQLPFGLGDRGLTGYRSSQEREFFETIRARARAAGWSANAWLRPNCITLSVAVDDASTGQLVKTLRVDFDGERIALGYDATHQLVDEPEFEPAPARRPIHELAAEAADWLEEQLAIDQSRLNRHVLDLPAPKTRRRPW